MKLNIFVGIEGTHTLIDNMIGGPSIALPNNNKLQQELALTNIQMITGPLMREPLNRADILDTVLSNMFNIIDNKTVCNLGFFGFKNTTTTVMKNAPVGSRLWFFRPTDTRVTAECLIDMSTNCSLAGNHRIIEEYGDSITTIEQALKFVGIRMDKLTNQVNAINNLHIVHDWQPFNAELFNGGNAPLTSSIEAMCWEISL
jgi:hypothetical protein